ncbi:SDR family NAD(P)-dependent oxidoreductase [Mesorhizobium sp. YIM 152430]|uniref:SDR family oxidoreductase n=1 Tax=Mesorhizobium sp. YIM 152430 TaxID=3031761 RepID=UPI0023DBF28A|nr:SDR family oxidoreductase [Mesorhizobium sp. YIM 152430]MDF1600996.1 SDR family NAD(P)-dependent oxidoreductase [Mesorhizobium sp. YIM 152430]
MNGTDRTAIVTGAGTGIGKAIAAGLVDKGFRVALAGRRADILEAAAREMSDDPARVLAVPTDIGDAAAVARLFETVETCFGQLDLLVNNAGTNTPAVPIEELSLDQWNAILGANLTGAFLCTQAAFRIMKRQDPRGGRILNNGSLSATTPRPHSAPYTATKHAITGLTKATALDGREFGIACGQFDVGNAATDMTQRMTAGVLQADGRRMSEPRMDVRHVADAVVHMATLPPEANILFLNVMATNMPFVGRG